MFSNYYSKSVLFALITVFLWLGTGSAFAQTVSITESGIRRSNGLRPSNQNPMWISKADCLADDSFTFPLVVSNYSSYQLEVWAGSSSDDCRNADARRGTTAVCWQLWKGVPTSTSVSVVARSQDIVSRRKPSGSAPSGPGTGTAADCEWSEATTAPIEVGIYFMFVEAGSDQQQGGALWTTKYDLAGPVPPDGVTAGIGDKMVVVRWDESTDTDRAGYKFFCDPSPGMKTNQVMVPRDLQVYADDASVEDGTTDDVSPQDGSADDVLDGSSTDSPSGGGADDAGSKPEDGGGGGSASGDGQCSSSVLQPGKEPDKAYECGSGTGTSGTISGLDNGVEYVIAVAAVDGVGNVGKLSNLACATPNQVDDFFTVYRNAGGRAGGGFCAMSGRGVGAGAAALLAAVVAVAFAVVIRRRRS